MRPAFAPKTIGELSAPRFWRLLNEMNPALTVSGPVKVLLPLTVSVPLPDFVTPLEPEITRLTVKGTILNRFASAVPKSRLTSKVLVPTASSAPLVRLNTPPPTNDPPLANTSEFTVCDPLSVCDPPAIRTFSPGLAEDNEAIYSVAV